MKKNKLFSGIMALTIAISSPAYASESDTEATEEIAATEDTETAGTTGTVIETETAAGDDKFSSDNTDLIYRKRSRTSCHG